MLQRKKSSNLHRIGSGPGNVCKALGIELTHNGTELDKMEIWITKGEEIEPTRIVSTTRIGVEYAKEDALLAWRFYIKDNPAVSKK